MGRTEVRPRDGRNADVHTSERVSRLLVLALASAALFSSACSSSRPQAAGDESTVTLPPIAEPGAGCDPAVPKEGCACATPGANEACGSVKEVVDDRVICSIGRIICGDDSKWGECTSERIIVRTQSRLSTAALGTPAGCADPCTPNCQTTTDVPNGIVVPSGLTADSNGLTITPIPPPPNSCTGITITPSSAPGTDITVTSLSTLTTKQFTSALVPANCNPSAPAPLWYTDKFDIAQMSTTTPGLLTAAVPIAGPVSVGASLGSFTASVTANLIVAVQQNSTTNPPPAGASFTQFPAEAAGDPTDANLEILYPYTGTIFPMGLPSPLLQWRHNAQAASGGVVVTLQYPATGTPIFSVSTLVSESMTAPVPLRAAQPRFPFPQSTWFAFEQTIHRNRATRGDTGRILVRRRVGTTTYKAKSIDVRIAPGQLKGRIYYDSYGTALAKNYSGALQSTGGAFAGGSFGGATLVIPPGATTPTVAAGYDGSGGCYVCHSASADGRTLISSDSAHISKRFTFPGTPPNGGTSYGTKAMNFSAINPASTRIFTSAGGSDMDNTSRLFGIDGTLVAGANVPAAMKGIYPAFAVDGRKVAFTHRSGSASPLYTGSVSGKTLATMDFDGNATFSNFRNLVTPAEGPAVWPSFLPTGGIVYEVETRTTPNGGIGYTRHDIEGSTYSGATGELWWVSTGATPVATRLHRANGFNAAGTAGDLPVTPTTGHAGFGGTNGPAGAGFYEQRYNYEPSVLPQDIGGYSWVMFTSRRAYGNVATINPYASDPRYDNISIDPTPKKLWMSAVTANPTAGTDPSAPAFYFPGQELISGNSRAVFSLEACHPAAPANTTPTAANLCDSTLDCCAGAECVLDPPPLANPPVKHCVAATGNVCRNRGESCLTTSNCCGAVGGDVCAGGVCTAPPAYYNPVTYTREYTTSCEPGYLIRWGHFDWQSRTPSNSRVTFSAQQGDGTTFSPATPVTFATAQGADILPPFWATGGTKISQVLGTPNGSTNRALRVSMTLTPSADQGQAPVLIDWRLSVECVAAE